MTSGLAFGFADVGRSFAGLHGTLYGRYVLWGLVLVVVAIGAARFPARAKEWILAGASIALIDVFTTRAVCATYVAYAVAFFLACHFCPWRRVRMAVLTLLLAAMIVVPVLLVTETLVWLEVPQRQFIAFATNVMLLRFVTYASRHAGEGRGDLPRFLLAMSFFPTVMNGPIEGYDEVLARRDPRYWNGEGERARLARVAPGAFGRIGWGTCKYVLAVTFLGSRNLEIFLSSGASVDTLRLWLWVPELYFLFYLGFSGWADMSIGLGRLLGSDVAENFDRPYAAHSVADFWNRWHITFGRWLREHIYIPLGGNRSGRWRNVVVVFLVSALWHVWGALKLVGPTVYPPPWWSGFVAWGLLNALGVIAVREVRDVAAPPLPPALRHRLAQVATFVFVGLAWIPFYLPASAPLDSWIVIIARLFRLT
jgi:D-alanyl-lipoteichoic acid acyltransferase DltB (MBOAT superfamily)